jgi:predicted PurR-regulated permease PerM
VTIALVLAGLAVLVPFAVPLILAAWTAELLRPLMLRLERASAGRRRAASAVTLLILVGLIVPLAAAVAVLAGGAQDLLEELRRISSGASIRTLLAQPRSSLEDTLLTLARAIRAGSLDPVVALLRGSARFAIAFAVFIGGVYVFSARGEAIRGWLREASPLPARDFDRLAAAFCETGHGLFIGIGLTAVAQGVIAFVTYAALGIPRAPLFAFLTAIVAFLPTGGTALVWAPIDIVLFMTGHPIKGGILAAVGLGVISTVDNLLRPLLVHRGQLQLTPFVLFVSMLGAVTLFGASGIVLGPLFVRMAVEALAIARPQSAPP